MDYMIAASVKPGFCINRFRASRFIISYLSIGVFLTAEMHGQVSPVYAKHYNYEQFVNPAITGRDRYPLVSLSHKRNWIGTKDAPTTTCAGASFRLGTYDFYTPTMMLNRSHFLSKDRMGFGGFIMIGQNGPITQFYSSVTYAYFVPLNTNRTTELSFGLSAHIRHTGINEDMLDPIDPGDPELASLNGLPYQADGDFGMHFHTKQFYAGCSINELFHTQSPLDESRYYKNTMDFFFQSGYKFYLRRFDLEPSVFLGKTDKDPLYVYTQIRAYYKNYNWLAVAYKSYGTLTMSVGFRVGHLHLAYAYEQSITSLSKYFGGSHEIMLGLNIGLFEPEGIRKTVSKK
jgi:type IX secretion system PorP/SprF family membrane protein